MASIDMCEHDCPGSGCKQCFPEKIKFKEPEELGYYWAKLFSHEGEPCIVYVNSQFVVSATGDRDRYSFHYDVVEWCSDRIKFKEKEVE